VIGCLAFYSLCAGRCVLYGGMPLICQPSQRGLEPGTCHTRSQRKKHVHTMDKPLSTKSSQRNNAAYVHTVNVVLPEKPHSTHLVASGKGDETAASKDRTQNVETNLNPNAEISAVPDPVPNPLIPAVPSFTAEQTGRPSVTGDASSGVFSTRLVAAPNSLLSLSYTASAMPITLTSTLPSSTSRSAEHPIGTFHKAPSRQTTPHQLSTTIITLLTLGGAFLVIAVLIGVKMWIQPRRRSHPTPSLPILQDAFPPARKMGDESPLFGGKERLSSQTGSGGVPWTWTQYQSGIPKPAPAANVSKSGESDQMPLRHSRQVDEEPPVTRTRESGIPRIPGTAKTNDGSDGHPSKALSRLSTLSGLVYPVSMYESPGQENIGIAVGYGQGLEYGGTVSPGRDVSKRRTRNMEKRRSTIYGSPEGLAYTMSPCMAPVVDEDQGGGFSRQGRARVKAPYGAGSSIRGSASSTEPNQKWVTAKMNMSAGLSGAGDKPPRVPSPPIFPSLAQMADYRSPTYSLYGLYS
jgi:hypothetical protein